MKLLALTTKQLYLKMDRKNKEIANNILRINRV